MQKYGIGDQEVLLLHSEFCNLKSRCRINHYQPIFLLVLRQGPFIIN